MSLIKFTKLSQNFENLSKISKCLSSVKSSQRFYSIKPPEWLGGKSMFNFSGQYDFPEHSKSFEEIIKEIEAQKLIKNPKKVGRDIGEARPENIENEDLQNIIIKNKKNKELEKLARMKQLFIPMDEMKADWWLEFGPSSIKLLAEHYGLYKDLFDGNFFYPIVKLKVNFDYDDDLVTPAYHGNIISPCDAQSAPHISYESSPDTLWTLLLVNPDESLTNQNQEYIHWMVCNIPGDDISMGDTLITYIPPIPAKGTGFHRNVFILFQQKDRMNYEEVPRIASPSQDKGIDNLNQRLFSTHHFHTSHSSNLTPKALAFFQSEWDETVRTYYRDVLGMGEGVFSYDWPTAYHPPPKKYPHKQPFNIYFDRYRDKKDIGEEVLRMKMKNTDPFKPQPDFKLHYPLAHRPKYYKPTWLKLKEELFLRRVDQFKDLD